MRDPEKGDVVLVEAVIEDIRQPNSDCKFYKINIGHGQATGVIYKNVIKSIEERPLVAGGRARSKDGGKIGDVLCIHDDSVWFKVDGEKPFTYRAEFLIAIA